MPVPPHPSVAILLCTCQGQAFLAEQLQSFAVQTCSAWSVWASDDASTDATRRMLEEQRAQWGAGRLVVVDGPARGFAANFRALTRRAEIQADYYAYADQDDIWEADKLERAVRWLETVPASTPALYCSRTRLIDETGRAIGCSPLFTRQPAFANALVQNLAGGNTMVFNDAARRRLIEAADAAGRAATYDWWTYLLVSGCGGVVHYDPIPTVNYRQHARNQVGANTQVVDRARNVRQMLRGRLRDWIDGNLDALDQVRDLLTADARERLQVFRQARERAFLPRVIGMARSGVHRQTIVGNVGLALAVTLKRV